MSARDERLADFLLARIAEDEVAVQTSPDSAEWGWWAPDYGFTPLCTDLPDKSRVLAECAAKREIVTDLRRWELLARGGGMSAFGAASGLRVACLRLVAVYKDHPDFDEVWLP